MSIPDLRRRESYPRLLTRPPEGQRKIFSVTIHDGTATLNSENVASKSPRQCKLTHISLYRYPFLFLNSVHKVEQSATYCSNHDGIFFRNARTFILNQRDVSHLAHRKDYMQPPEQAFPWSSGTKKYRGTGFSVSRQTPKIPFFRLSLLGNPLLRRLDYMLRLLFERNHHCLNQYQKR